MTGQGWRSGPRESVKCTDPLASAGHPLAVAHREAWGLEVAEKFRRLFGRSDAAQLRPGGLVGEKVSPNA